MFLSARLQSSEISKSVTQLTSPSCFSQRFGAGLSVENNFANGHFGNVNIGIYKGMRVAVRIMRISKFTTTRSVLLELKQMRDLTHENLIRLIGLTAEDPNVGVVMEFSPRGSLRVSYRGKS